jgi:hypothetical protein
MKSSKSRLDLYTRHMAAINTKQVPLCRTHHIGLHNDTWTNEEKAIFNFEARKKTSNKKK